MAKVYGVPAEFPVPRWNIDASYEVNTAAEKAYLAGLASAARLQSATRRGKPEPFLIGETVGFHVADGQALYMVWNTKPLELVHVPFGDAYQIPDAHARGLNLTDIKQRVEGERRMRELFESRKAATKS